MNAGIIGIFSNLIAQGPTLLVYAVGIGGALSQRQRWPNTARLVLIGLSWLLATGLFFPIVTQWVIYSRIAGNGGSSAALGVTMSVLGIGASVAHAIGIGFLITAAFSQSRSASPSHRVSQDR